MNVGGVERRPQESEAILRTQRTEKIAARQEQAEPRPAYRMCLGEEAELAIKAFAIVRETSDVRPDAVGRVLRAIRRGAFELNSGQIAERIVGSL